jgi:hypothetical protein
MQSQLRNNCNKFRQTIIPGFENNQFNERGTNYFTSQKERKSYRRSFGRV